jgi:hypothetical protein
LPTHILLTLYNSLCLPHLNYGILSWGSSNTGNIFKIQKKIMRIIGNSKYNSHTDPLFKKFQVLKLTDLHILHELRFCYKLQKSLLPHYFTSNLFIRNSQTHAYNTVHSLTYRIPIIKHEFARRNIRYRIPKTYNNCPQNILSKIDTHSLAGYVNYIKHYYLQNYTEQCLIVNCYVCNNHST